MMKKAALSLSICLLLSAGGCKPASPSGSSGASAASQPAAPYSEREEDSSVSPLLQEVAGETEQYPSLLNFPVSEIDRIDVSSYILPNQISEKTVTRTEDFQTIWDALTALTVIRNAEKTGCHLWGRGADLYISPEKRGNPDGRHFRKHCVLRRLLLYGRGPLPATSLGRAGVSRPWPGIIRIGR